MMLGLGLGLGLGGCGLGLDMCGLVNITASYHTKTFLNCFRKILTVSAESGKALDQVNGIDGSFPTIFLYFFLSLFYFINHYLLVAFDNLK